MKSSLLLILLAGAGPASSAWAGPTYKCAGPTGATVFSQTPCGKDAFDSARPGRLQSRVEGLGSPLAFLFAKISDAGPIAPCRASQAV